MYNPVPLSCLENADVTPIIRLCESSPDGHG